MKRSYQYTLREDVIPFIDGVKGTLPLQVHLYQFPTFDEAFLQLYFTPVGYFGADIARMSGLSHYINSATIYSSTDEQPIVQLRYSLPLDRTSPDQQHLRNSTVFLEKGDSHELLKPGLRQLFKTALIDELESPAIIFATYDRAGTHLTENHKDEKDILYNALRSTHVTMHITPYVVEIRSNVYRGNLPTGTKRGVAVKQSIAVPDLKAAYAALLAVNIEETDLLVAYNKQLHQTISSAMIRDRGTRNMIAEIRNVTEANVDPQYPAAGIYLHFANPAARYLTQSLVPEIAALDQQLPTPRLLLGSRTEERTGISLTQSYFDLKKKLGGTDASNGIQGIRRPRSRDDPPGSHKQSL